MDHLFIATSIKGDGNMSFKWGPPAEVLAHRERYFKKIGVPLERTVFMGPPDENAIVRVTSKDCGRGARERGSAVPADAFLTSESDVYLCLFTADCLPVVAYDPVHAVISLAHLGWRSTDQGLIGKMIRTLAEDFRARPADLSVTIGPGIHAASYLFPKLEKEFTRDWSRYIRVLPDGTTSLDLVGHVCDQLLVAGITTKNLSISDIDTGRDQDYFSHRRSAWAGDPEGRFVTVVGLRV